MTTASASITGQYQGRLWGPMDRTLRNCFRVSAALGVAVLIAVFVAPTLPTKQKTVEDVPERIARLILERPKPAAPPKRIARSLPRVETPPAQPKPPTQRRRATPKVKPSEGTTGRQLAQREVKQNLAQVTGSLDKVMESLSKSLPASETKSDAPKSRRRRRGVRSGRSSRSLASVQDAPSVNSPDISGSGIEMKGIQISAITDLTVDGAGVPGGTDPSGSGPAGSNQYRSNEALLSVVRRYAPGIQFCYDNELKKHPGLRGKLVVTITVEASGAVSEALIGDNTLRSSAVTQCVLSQIRGWQFPEIPHGTTTFNAPFVFTPPE